MRKLEKALQIPGANRIGTGYRRDWDWRGNRYVS
jgi:hypothetical protein